MAVGACALVFLLTVAAVAAARERLGMGQSLREAVLIAAAVVGGFVAAVTEGLGAIGELRFGPVLGCWLAAGFILTCWLYDHRGDLTGWCKPMLPFHWCELGLLALLGIILGTSALIAILCPPNNFDVALYHLPRQLQWLQQGSVAHFPTQDYRLTVNPPFSEFVGLHFMLLSGTDRLATIESWLSMILALGAVSLVGRELCLSRTGQILSALFAATVPVGFHEATNGKNDWMVAFWLAATTFWVLRVWKADRIRPVEAICAGLSLGLLILTKGTGGIYAVPLIVMGGLGLMVRQSPGWLPALLAVAALSVLPNLGHCSRNYRAYGSISGKTFGLDNERHTPEVWVSGLARNVGMHLATPRDAWNRKVDKYVHRLHDWLGISTDDPETTWLGVPFKIEFRSRQEDFATAPVHTVLLFVAIPALIPLVFRERSWLIYLSAAAGGLVLFGIVFKWQPWHPRLHLPCFALGGVAFGWLSTRTPFRWLMPAAVALGIWSVVPAATRSEARSIGPGGLNVFTTDADHLRFFNHDDILKDAREVTARIQALHPHAVELINQQPAPWEYPIALWLKEGEAPPRVGYFYPVAGSPNVEPPADVVLDIGGEYPPPLIRHPRTRIIYYLESRVGRFSIYRTVDWKLIPSPDYDQPVARFGIGTEPPESTE